MSRYHGRLWNEQGRTHAVTYGKSKPKAAPKQERAQTTEEQDRERASLAEVEAPFYPMVRWPEGPSALSDMVRTKPDWSRKRKA